MYHIIRSEDLGTPAADYPLQSFDSLDTAREYAEEYANENQYGVEVIDEDGEIVERPEDIEHQADKARYASTE